jgi:hypothetical protein
MHTPETIVSRASESRRPRVPPLAAPLAACFAALLASCAQPGSPALMHGHVHGAAAGGPDLRTRVDFPEPMRVGTLANMRDHLLAIAEIQASLGAGRFDEAATVAERRLGMSSLGLHGAHDASRFMPQGMQDIGTTMHRMASQFAIAAQNASATGDPAPALRALARVTQACVACHAAYRLQ